MAKKQRTLDQLAALIWKTGELQRNLKRRLKETNAKLNALIEEALKLEREENQCLLASKQQ